MTAETSRFAIRKRHTPSSAHHKFWTVWYLQPGKTDKRVAVYTRWDAALAHVETVVRRFRQRPPMSQREPNKWN